MLLRPAAIELPHVSSVFKNGVRAAASVAVTGFVLAEGALRLAGLFSSRTYLVPDPFDRRAATAPGIEAGTRRRASVRRISKQGLRDREHPSPSREAPTLAGWAIRTPGGDAGRHGAGVLGAAAEES